MDERVQRRVQHLSGHFDVTQRLPRQHASSGGLQFDVQTLQHILEHDNHGNREGLKELMKDELFVP